MDSLSVQIFKKYIFEQVTLNNIYPIRVHSASAAIDLAELHRRGHAADHHDNNI